MKHILIVTSPHGVELLRTRPLCWLAVTYIIESFHVHNTQFEIIECA